MDYENLEFLEALRILAKKAGIELSETDFVKRYFKKREDLFRKQNLLGFLSLHSYKTQRRKKALEYLTKVRKIDPRLIETFLIGFSPIQGDILSKYLIEKKKI